MYREVDIKLNGESLKGNLRLSEKSTGIILFAHGSGSSRFSIRNNYVAGLLLEKGFSSLLFDLLTFEEGEVYENRFDIELLTNRLIKVTKWIQEFEETKHLPIGYFGSSTGAASALKAATKLNETIKAIVSRGGRPDLAFDDLKFVQTPTLLLVGGNDGEVIDLNLVSKTKIPGICELKIIDGASHLFIEPGKLQAVAKETIEWFDIYLN